jgi:NAD(P)-dependent dehydrogenase (short-subunit alcohol dehydrogenase family)
MTHPILVVGASSGIGGHIAKQLIASGHEVIGIGRSEAPHIAQYHAIDIFKDALPVIDQPLSGIVYCIGSINLRPFRALKVADFKQDYEVNVLGAVQVLQQYGPNLQKSGSGSVVLFSTVAVQTGMPYHASIAAAKGAVEGLTRSLAAEWAPTVRVNCIAPSLTGTHLAARLLDNEQKRAGAQERHPLKAVGQPEDIAAMAVMLLSSQTKFMTGQVIAMDGGIGAVK